MRSYNLVHFTCKLLVTIAPASKLGNKLSRQLEDEDSAGFVVNHDHVTVLVHRNALWSHESARAEFCLVDSKFKQ